MNAIANCFDQLRKENKKALITYLTAGDPDLDFTYAAALSCLQSGADILELGVPFSDPLADGPTIRASAKRALASGTTFNGVIELVKRLRSVTQAPIVLLCYYNTICSRGESSFATTCARAGVSGVIVADLPVSEASNMANLAANAGLDLIPLIAPNSTPTQIANAARLATGFIYCVSVKGVTGVRETLPETLGKFLASIRRQTDKPLAVGFGIAHPQQALQIAHAADGIIIGSVLVDLLATKRNFQAIQPLLTDFRLALDKTEHDPVKS